MQTLYFPTVVWGKTEQPTTAPKPRLVKADNLYGEYANEAIVYMGKNPPSKAQIQSWEALYETHAEQMAMLLNNSLTGDQLREVARGRGRTMAEGVAVESALWELWDAWAASDAAPANIRTRPGEQGLGHKWLKGVAAYHLIRSEREAQGKPVTMADTVVDENKEA